MTAPPTGFWHNCKHPCGVLGCVGHGTRVGEAIIPRMPMPFPAQLKDLPDEGIAAGLRRGPDGRLVYAPQTRKRPS